MYRFGWHNRKFVCCIFCCSAPDNIAGNNLLVGGHSTGQQGKHSQKHQFKQVSHQNERDAADIQNERLSNDFSNFRLNKRDKI